MADATACLDRIADAADARYARGPGIVAVLAVRVRRVAGRFTTADDRRHRTPETHRTDAPQGIKVRPRGGPLAHEDVAEAALDTDRRVTRRRRNGDVVRPLHRCVLLDLEPRGQTTADALPPPEAVVRSALSHVPLAYRGSVRRGALRVLEITEGHVDRAVHLYARLRERDARRGQGSGHCHR